MGLMLIPQTLELLSSNLAASTLDEYNPATGYTAGQQVKVSFESDGTTPRSPVREYQAVAATTGVYPPDDADDSDWVLLGAQNRDRLLDGENNSRAIADPGEDIEISVRPPGRARYLYLIGLRNAASITVQEITGDPGSEVVQSTTTRDQLRSRNPVGFYSWLLDIEGEDRYYSRSAAILLPNGYYQPKLSITIASSGLPAECGQCLVGTGFSLGRTQFKSDPGLKDWSIFEQNKLGVSTHTKRQSTRTLRGTLRIDSRDYDRVYSLLESRQGELALFDFNNTEDGDYVFDAQRVYGKLDSFSGPLLFGESDINLKITGTE